MAKRMNIKGVPASVGELDRWSRDYERANLRFSESSRRVADDTLGLFLSWYPRPLRPLIRLAVFALLEERLLDAFGYPHPPAWFRSLLEVALKLRARVVALLPRRTRPRLVTQEKHRAYPGGYRLEQLGVEGLEPAGRG